MVVILRWSYFRGGLIARFYCRTQVTNFGTCWLFIAHFWAAKRRPYIVFTFTGSVWNVWNDVYIYIYIYIYIYMSTTWRTQSRYVIFRLYFGKIHSFASDFISEESFRPEEFFKDDFQAIRVSRAVGGPQVF